MYGCGSTALNLFNFQIPEGGHQYYILESSQPLVVPSDSVRFVVSHLVLQRIMAAKVLRWCCVWLLFVAEVVRCVEHRVQWTVEGVAQYRR